VYVGKCIHIGYVTEIKAGKAALFVRALVFVYIIHVCHQLVDLRDVFRPLCMYVYTYAAYVCIYGWGYSCRSKNKHEFCL
jgi:hypothetical protein